MDIRIRNTLPLPDPDQVVFEGEGNAFWLFRQKGGLFAKIDIRNLGHGTVLSNLEEIRLARRVCDELVEAMEFGGCGQDVVLENHFFLHDADRITYCRVQKWVDGGRELSRLNLRDFGKVPKESLIRLKRLFGIYINYLDAGKDIDLFGYHYKHFKSVEKLARCWSLLLWSDNILVDTEMQIKVVDYGIWNTNARVGLAGWVWKQTQKFRTRTSIWMINGILWLISARKEDG